MATLIAQPAPSARDAMTRTSQRLPGAGSARPGADRASRTHAHPGLRRQADIARCSDGALLEQARAGDAAAFAAVYDRHASAAYSLARRMMHNQGAAQDVVQEAFLGLWRSDSYCTEKGSLRSFLLMIVRNRAIDALRRDRRRSSHERLDETAVTRLAAGDLIEVEVEQREAERLLRAALVTLPEAQHRALELAFFAGLTHHEIALRLDEPLGTIKGRIRLGLEKLRAEIDASNRQPSVEEQSSFASTPGPPAADAVSAAARDRRAAAWRA